MSFALHAECVFIVSGNLVRDTVVRAVESLEFGATVWVDSIVPSLGGNGANTAYGLAKLGAPVTLVSACGDDEAGTACLRFLHEAGVHTAFLPRMAASTAITIALVNAKGERAFLHHPGVNQVALDGTVEFQACELSKDVPWHYHLANPFALPAFREHAAPSLLRANRMGATTSLDTGWDSKGRWLEDLEACLPLVDLLFINDREAEQITGHREAGQMANALHRQGARRVLLKLGEQGCLLSDEDDREVIPAFYVDVADTTGAGDVFVAGYLAALRRGQIAPDAARFANAVAALSVQQSGSIAGLRGFDETLAWIDEQDCS
ncbi:MAG: carbohydrate kinase family protein [Bryobacterales bacterium]|nr:carbohydrate kinase family protein [Bryobacterales bacterium]